MAKVTLHVERPLYDRHWETSELDSQPVQEHYHKYIRVYLFHLGYG